MVQLFLDGNFFHSTEENDDMGFLSKITSGAKSVDLDHPKKTFGWGLGSHVVQKAEYLGASYLAARVNTQFGEKAKWRGVEITFGGGLLLMIGSVLAQILGFDNALLPHANTLGTALVATHVASIGAKHGLEAAASSVSKPALPGKTTSVGSLGQAAPGSFLDLERAQRLAAMHGG